MTARDVRAALARRGLLARRDLGQNFLTDPRVAADLVERAGVAAGDSVIEIGTGLGLLTGALAARAERVVTIEIDAGLVRALREEDALAAHVELLHADALEVDWRELAGRLAPRVRVVANLPYSVSTPLLRKLLDVSDRLLDWVVMLQREVAARLLAAPGTRDYGSLAVLHHWLTRVERLRDVPPSAFFPVPRVSSTVVRVTPRGDPALGLDEVTRVEPVLRAAFGARRKTLPNALRARGVTPPGGERCEALLERLGLDPRVRAEALDPSQLLGLARALRPTGRPPPTSH